MVRLGGCAAIAILLMPCPARSGEIDVRVTDGRVELTSDAAPLSEILARLSQTLGFELEREGNVPNPLVPALELKGRTSVETVLAVLEGLGLDHALTIDDSGTGVEKLLLVAASPPTSRQTRPAGRMPFSGRPARPASPPPEAFDPAPDWDAEAEPDETALAEPGAAVEEDNLGNDVAESEPDASDEGEEKQPAAALPGRLVTPGGDVQQTESSDEEP